tara:strand:+ start:1126 stop:1245 length:120 start_codon:yes stop_codon:yes gene_type:complete
MFLNNEVGTCAGIEGRDVAAPMHWLIFWGKIQERFSGEE